jgi:lipopolysaccharide/colanic/teichoic acid biosynthesis glycosyltransferase
MQTAIPGALTDSPLAVEIAEPRAEHSPAHPVPLESPPLLATATSVTVVAGSTAYELTKRALDLLLGIIGLILTGLASLVVVPLVLLSSDGPAVFTQTRVGKDGRKFNCYKFRTMDPDAESRKDDIAHLNEIVGPAFKIKDDPRHVRELRWLRKFSIDEMPQFWNVVRGDMSIVGPRPPEPQEVEQYTPHQRGRLAVKPGLTCTWQVNGRSAIDFEHWVEMDLEYIQRRSTRLDLKLIIKTIPAILSCRGAS